jgi:antirestriction protein
MEEYQEYFPIPCVGEIVKVAKLASTMSEYRTAASWMWENVYSLKASMTAVKQECPKLLQLLLF